MSESSKLAYAIAVSKGSKLLKLMSFTDSEAGAMLEPPQLSAQSPFLTMDALLQSGYSTNLETLTNRLLLSQVQQTLGVDTKDNVFVGHSHLNSSENEDGEYVPITYAKFNTVISSSGGMIAAIDNESPTQATQRRRQQGGKHAGVLPALKYWSDVSFVQWESVTNGLANLQYVVRLGIANPPTLAIIKCIMENKGIQPCSYNFPPGLSTTAPASWPDTTWRLDQDEEPVAALLGTPNGAGVARLLIHHKKQLGHKRVEAVQLVNAKGDLPYLYGEPSLVFKIGNIRDEGDDGFGGSQETIVAIAGEN
ncbi:hypothetical protein TW65_01033 [Stemphylium lycopersici]|uniref:Uncharacterized protein n=1 Tax=Stemphylium lycopersici TaxID=183478 RepID=A0A364MWM9_STELY|nr:hypothetical protein TW65_01033 [Stemphylium lycopersici]RAR05763.1 hypothetical protein DDE83_007223 [Stemphylium lycopersici]